MNKRNGFFALVLAVALTLSGCSGTDSTGESDSQSPVPPVDTDTDVTTVSGVDGTDGTYETESTDTVIIIDTTAPYTTAGEETGEITSEPAHTGTVDVSNQIVQTAEMLLGIPFEENGVSPVTGFDNSGFIYYVLRENGFINCPRLTNEQAAMGTVIGYDELKSGDLAFFCTADSGKPDFGGIYIGNGQMIYCPMPGQTVKIADVSIEYWRRTFVSGVRLS